MKERIYKTTHEGLECEFCGKLCKNTNSLVNHERFCSKNPNKRPSGFEIAKSNGVIITPPFKGKSSSDEIIQNWKLKYEQNRKLGLHKSNSHPHTKETKEKISKTMSEKELGGINSKRFSYEGENLQSSYELQVAIDLDANNIKWEKCHKAFPYLDHNNVKRHYIPDFYLPEYNVYLDPKNDYLINDFIYEGFSTKEKIKWVQEQNAIKVLVLNSTQLNWASIQSLL